MVKIVTKSHIVHKPSAHSQKFHSILGSYLIKWKDTELKKEQNKTDIQVNSKNQILWKGFCKRVILQGFAALLNSLLMDNYTQVTTLVTTCHVYTYDVRDKLGEVMIYPSHMPRQVLVCSVLSFPFTKQKSLMDIFIKTEMNWVSWVES